AARIVVGLAHLDRLAAIRSRIVEPRATAGVDLDLECDAEFLAIAEDGVMGARDARWTGVPVHLGIEFAQLSCAVVHVEPGAAPDAPISAADAITRLQDDAIVAGVAELIGGRQSRDAGAQNDDLGAV